MGRVLLAAACFLFLGAILGPVYWLLVGAWFVLAIYVASVLWTRVALRSLRARRRCPDRAFAGQTVRAELRLENRGILPIPWVEIWDQVPGALGGAQLRERVVSLGPLEKRTISYELECSSRGYYPLGPAWVTTGDVLGVSERHASLADAKHIIVYPRIVSLDDLKLPTYSALVAIPDRRPLYRDPSRIVGVRDYQAGDPLRSIHWPATARQDRLLVKQYQPAISRETLICLSLCLADYPLRDRSRLTEFAITVAASMLHHIIVGESLPVGLATIGFDPLNGEEGRMVLPVGAGIDSLAGCLEVLARVQVPRQMGFEELLRDSGASLTCGATVIVVSGSLTPAVVESMAWLRESGHSLAAVLVAPEEADEAAAAAVGRVWHVGPERPTGVA